MGYLKSLGVLRVVALQADAAARGRWSAGTFELRSRLDQQQVVEFLLDSYQPAPVVSPWNGGSGFYPKDNQDAIVALERAENARFMQYRDAIGAAREALRKLGIEEKPSGGEKLALVRELRRTLPDAAIDWLDAAVVVIGERVAFPSLLGSGGNDGRYDFSNNYAQAVLDCLEPSKRKGSSALLSAALIGGPAQLDRKRSLAHFYRDSSPTNSPAGEADSLGNPWDLALAVEGALVLAAGAVRRHGAPTGRALMAAPFTVRQTSAGYGSAASGEPGRDELWLPLWPRWASYREIVALAREARSQVRTSKSLRQAASGLDFARAAGELGVARGVESFERFAILERAGQAKLAVPAGRIAVAPRPAAAALESIDGWLGRLLGFARDTACPSAVGGVIRRVEHAAFQLACRGTAAAAQDVIEALGTAEHVLARSGAVRSAGLRPLAGAAALPWIQAASDGSPELTVAIATASLRDRGPGLPALRDYLHGTQLGEGGRIREFDEQRRHAVIGSEPVGVLAAVHARRHLDAAGHKPNQSGLSETGLPFDLGARCGLGPARMFAAGLLDEERTLRLIRGLALLDHDEGRISHETGNTPEAAQPAYDLLALAWMGGAVAPRQSEGPPLGARPGWAARLARDVTLPVLRGAILRLKLAGLPPIVRADDLAATRPSGARLGAALLLRIGRQDLSMLLRRATLPEALNDTDNRQKEA